MSAYAIDSDDPSSPTFDGAPELFLPRVTERSALADRIEVGRQPIQFNRKLATLSPGSEARLSLPLGVSYVLNFDDRVDHPSGNVTWVGSLKGYGDDYRAVITFGEGGVSGNVHTPDGDFLVETDAEGEWLVDPQAAGLAVEALGPDDALIPWSEEGYRQSSPDHSHSSTWSGEGAASDDSSIKGDLSYPFDGLDSYKDLAVAADTTRTTIDVVILYTPGLANRLGSGLSTRLDQLVALSNQAYRDSGIYIDLRLVHKQQVEYSDTTSNLTALDALTDGTDPALAGVASLRNTYGADLVSLIRPFNRNTAGGCGVAWIGGYGGQPISLHASYGYSVVSDGRDVSGSAYYCSNLSFTHELGHNMGSMHDRANAGGGSGAYPYSYGYGVNGTFGTVMSYIDPRIGKFSNPAITCAGGIVCGIGENAPNAANNALSLNNTRMAVADFRPTQYITPTSPDHVLTVLRRGSGTVTSAPSGIECGTTCQYSFPDGTDITLTATPADGYYFSGWSGACSGTEACTVALFAAQRVIATFTALPKYTLRVSKLGSGTVTSTPSGIECGTVCLYQFTRETDVTLSATPANGYYFSGWSGACTGTEACTVTLSAAQNVTATFKPNPTLVVRRSGSGTVVSDVAGIDCGRDCSERYPNGTTVTLTAAPDSGYTFEGWRGACTGTEVCTVTLSATQSVIAVFRAIPKYALRIYRSGAGTVTSDVAGIDCGSDCSELYLSDTAVVLTATPANGYYFSGWSGACTGTGACTVTLSATQNVTATFKPNPVLVVRRGGSGAVVSDVAGIDCGRDCRESYPSGTVVTLAATPASGYTFEGWRGACTGTDACTVTLSTTQSVIAIFRAIPKYTLTTYRRGGGAVVSDVAGISCGTDCRESYLSGTVVTLAATPVNSQYYFSGWSGACTGGGDCTVTLSAAQSVTATFKPNPVLVVRRSGSGTVTSDVAGIQCGRDCRESYANGTTVTLTAIPASGQEFESWVRCPAVDGATCTVDMTATKIVTATFSS